MVKLQALFSDYDGTLCPLEVPREKAIISVRLKRFLNRLSKKIPIGIVTTKDLPFMEDKVPFAHGIAAISGLEMRIGSRSIVDERVRRPPKLVYTAYRDAISKILGIHDRILIEQKMTEKGDLVAFCVEDVEQLVRSARESKTHHRKL